VKMTKNEYEEVRKKILETIAVIDETLQQAEAVHYEMTMTKSSLIEELENLKILELAKV